MDRKDRLKEELRRLEEEEQKILVEQNRRKEEKFFKDAQKIRTEIPTLQQNNYIPKDGNERVVELKIPKYDFDMILIILFILLVGISIFIQYSTINSVDNIIIPKCEYNMTPYFDDVKTEINKNNEQIEGLKQEMYKQFNLTRSKK